MDSVLKISAKTGETYNFASQQCGSRLIWDVVIKNTSDSDSEDLTLSINCDFEDILNRPYSVEIPVIGAGQEYQIENIDLSVNTDKLANIEEKISANLIISVSNTNTSAEEIFPVSFSTYNQWNGESMLLPSFVMPNSESVKMLLANAAKKLEDWEQNGSFHGFTGYQTRNADNVIKQAGSIYAAIKEQNIIYNNPPASFEQVGQKIRLGEQIINDRQGTCLDMALLFSSCLEACGIDPLLVLFNGHIIVGYWTHDIDETDFRTSLTDAVSDDVSELTKRSAAGMEQIKFVECTNMCSGNSVSFDDSMALGEKELYENQFHCVIDVRRARTLGIKPIPGRIFDGTHYVIDRNLNNEEVSSPETKNGSVKVSDEDFKERDKKIMMWERKLLDLNLNNNLIDMKLRGSIIPLANTSIANIEDSISSNLEFKFESVGEAGNKISSYSDLNNFILNCGAGNDRKQVLISALSETETQVRLKTIYRSAKSSVEESGANTLFLTFGAIKWFESEKSERPRFAPIILIPVEIKKKISTGEYTLSISDEDAHLNISILEKFKQDFDMDVPSLIELPQDDSGIDVTKVFAIIRNTIMGKKNWDVLEFMCLGIFSFTQFVMWSDLRNQTDKLRENQIVRSLMEGKLAFDEAQMEVPDKVDEEGVYLPLPADASQLYAIKSADEGKTFVLHGPPGSGKSQTITSMIANALANGKKVLFVAEKMAALDVVYTRLKKIGLEPFCLQLHSHKSKKRDVLDQLKLCIESTKTKYQSPEAFEQKRQEIAALRQELSAYPEALHKTLNCGFDLFELIDIYEKFIDSPDISEFDKQLLDNFSRDEYVRLERLIDNLVSQDNSVNPECRRLRYITLSSFSQGLRQNYTEGISDLSETSKKLCETGTKLNGLISSDYDRDTLNKISENLMKWYQYPEKLSKCSDLNNAVSVIESYCDLVQKQKEIKSQLSSRWNDEFYRENPQLLSDAYKQAELKWALPKTLAINAIAKNLKKCAVSEVDKNKLSSDIDELMKYSSLKSESDSKFSQVKEYFEETASLETMRNSAASVSDSYKELSELVSDDSFRIKFCGNNEIRESLSSYLEAYRAFEKSSSSFSDTFKLSADFEKLGFAELSDAVSSMSGEEDLLRDRIILNNALSDLTSAGLQNVVDSYNAGTDVNLLKGSCFKKISYQISSEYIESCDALKSFNGTSFDLTCSNFRRLDKELQDLSSKEIYCKLAASVPDFSKEAAKSSELGMINKAIGNNGRGITIRQLFKEASTLIQKLCPCFMMSPLSAAQYLEPNMNLFDLVIFDEASQLPTSKAVGVLARGKSAVIVGDPNQMPPTSFFQTSSFDEDDFEHEDLESILDDCLALNIPSTHLLWHYRSRHESLIAFSNSKFYDNKLYTFPSVNDRETKVSLHKVDGLFDRGKTRINRVEAEAIVEEIKKRFENPETSKQSIGVVTFNISQQALIEDLIDKECASNEEFARWINNEEEPFFVKNLENVQGDERDVIMFSISYGHDESGKIYTNFGPLNRDGGWRRLNVAVTRAKNEMVVFTSMNAEDIKISGTSSKGVRALRSFIEYAGGKALPSDANSVNVKSGNTSSIVKEIRDFLFEKGYDTDKYVGKSKCNIDVGVIDKKNPGRYMLGIMLDGDQYGNAGTVRDREVGRLSVLEGLGWKIYRIWTMDFWDDKESVLDRLYQTLCDIESDNYKTPSYDYEKVELKEDENPKSAPNFTIPYTEVQMNQLEIEASDIRSDGNRKYIEGLMLSVVSSEAPVSKDYMYRRILKSLSINRMSERLTSVLDEILSGIEHYEDSDGFIWNSEGQASVYKVFRECRGGMSRDLNQVCLTEISNAATKVIREQFSIEKEDLIRETAKLFGVTRVTENVRARVEQAISLGEEKGFYRMNVNNRYEVV